MVIREAGIMARGYPLVYSSYHETGAGIDVVLRSGLLSGILNFVESAFEKQIVEYIESKNYIIAFKADKILAEKAVEPEPIISYIIMDKEKKIDKFISKNISPLLKKILKEFILGYTGKNLSYISIFEDFKKVINKNFEIESKSLDEKIKQSLF